MDFQLNIKNIGKLSDAKIRIGQFTVLAGPNNTGKSTVSKLLYSIFDAMNANHTDVYLKNRTKPARKILSTLRLITSNKSIDGDTVDSLLKEFENSVRDFKIEDIEKLDKAILKLAGEVEKIQEQFHEINTQEESIGNQKALFPVVDMVREISKNAKEALDELHNELHNEIDDIRQKKHIQFGIKYQVMENLIENFQVSSLANLQGREDMRSVIDIEYFGEFKLENEELDSRIARIDLWEWPQHSGVIYLESPIYWKLKNALEDLRIHPRYSRGERVQLSGVPGYFYDMASALKHEYTGDIAFQSLYERLTGKDVLGGKIAISESGDLSFHQNGRSFSLPVTAMGVANLGILALLIERKVLDKKSVLFIDEPEAHLHPAWQVIMAETLFELAKGGVTVVIATHSIDILKWLEVEVKENPESKDLIALNQFSADSVKNIDQDFDDKMSNILQELTEPFATTFRRGV